MNKFDTIYEGILSNVKDLIWPKEENSLPIDYKRMHELKAEAYNLKIKADIEVKPLLNIIEKAFYVWGTALIYHTAQTRNKLSVFPGFFSNLGQTSHIKSTLKVTTDALNKLKKINTYSTFCKTVETELSNIRNIVDSWDKK